MAIRCAVRAGRRRCLAGCLMVVVLTACGTGVGSTGSANVPPSHFVSASAAFDADRGQLVLLGLVEGADGPVDETWIWNGQWTELHPLHSPSPARAPLLVDDPSDHAVLLYGGNYNRPSSFTSSTSCGGAGSCGVGVAYPTQQYADTWSWDGVDWRQIPLGASPHGSPGALAYVPSGDRLLMSFNGNPTTDTGTYRWDRTAWTRIAMTTFPEGSVAVDAATGAPVSYNGRQHGCVPDPCFSDLSTTETGDGAVWTPTGGVEPEPAAGNVVTDPTDGGVLLVNELGHTWVRVRGSWREAATQGPSPSSNGFLYSDGSRVYFQTEPDFDQQRWSWDGRAWRLA